MRKTIPTLALLTSLAAGAAAQSTATATSTATYSASSPAVTLTGVTQGFYDHGTPDYDDAGGKTTLTHTGSASGHPDRRDPHDHLHHRRLPELRELWGGRKPRLLRRVPGVPVLPHVHERQRVVADPLVHDEREPVAVDRRRESLRPRAYLDAAGDLGTGAYAFALVAGGVTDVTDSATSDLTYAPNSIAETANASLLGTSVPYATVTAGNAFQADFALAADASRTYEAFASTESAVQFAPVPEPAPLAALAPRPQGLNPCPLPSRRTFK